MRTPPQYWSELMLTDHITETRVDINGASYYGFDGNRGLWELSTSPALFDEMSVGNCYSAQLNMTLVNPDNIPTMSKIEIYVRLKNDSRTTDWVRKGVYYIDTREWDAQHEFLTITGYDAMLMLDQPYITSGSVGTWPKTDVATVNDICARVGLTLDSRVAAMLNKGYLVQMPMAATDGSGDTLREVLGWIGAMYAGNWCISDDGELRLVPLVPTEEPEMGLLATESGSPILFGSTRILVNLPMGTESKALDMQIYPAYDAIGTVRLVVSEELEYVAGTTGREIEIQCPWGTQAMANNLLSELTGFVYQPLSLTTATAADPLWELGDLVRSGDYVAPIISQANTFTHAYTCDISAPNDAELNHEYPYQDKSAREIKREIAKSTASIEVNVNEIKAQVTNANGDYTVVTLDDQGLIHLGNQSGTVEINGDALEANSITADKLNITGAITFGDLDTATQNTITDASDNAEEAANKVSAWAYGGTTYIDGNKIMAGTVMASELLGGIVGLLNSNEEQVGSMEISGSSSSDYAIQLESGGALRLIANAGAVNISNGSHYLQVGNAGNTSKGDLFPNSDNSYSCGQSGFRWSVVYAGTSAISTSDREKKKDISYDMSAYEELFDRLKPTPYKFIDGTSGRTHTGFISQDIEESLAECGLTSTDFAAFVKSPNETGYDYALRYEEFIALNTWQIQKLKEENAELKARLDRLEAKING